MNSQNTLFSYTNSIRLTDLNTARADGIVAKAGLAAAEESGSGNYLPGLRAVEHEVEAYFKNDFVWLGY